MTRSVQKLICLNLYIYCTNPRQHGIYLFYMIKKGKLLLACRAGVILRASAQNFINENFGCHLWLKWQQKAEERKKSLLRGRFFSFSHVREKANNINLRFLWILFCCELARWNKILDKRRTEISILKQESEIRKRKLDKTEKISSEPSTSALFHHQIWWQKPDKRNEELSVR